MGHNNVCKMGVMETAHFSLLSLHLYQLMLFYSPYMKDVPICCGLWLIWLLKVDEPLQFSHVIKSRLRHDLRSYNVTHINTGLNQFFLTESPVLAAINHQSNRAKGRPPGSSCHNLCLMAEVESAGSSETHRRRGRQRFLQQSATSQDEDEMNDRAGPKAAAERTIRVPLPAVGARPERSRAVNTLHSGI